MYATRVALALLFFAALILRMWGAGQKIAGKPGADSAAALAMGEILAWFAATGLAVAGLIP